MAPTRFLNEEQEQQRQFIEMSLSNESLLNDSLWDNSLSNESVLSHFVITFQTTTSYL